ncbi:hypothetical protein EJB05_33927, partial [Eragrostis curvula]
MAPTGRHEEAEEASRSQSVARRRLPAATHEEADVASSSRSLVGRRRRRRRRSPSILARVAQSEDEHRGKRKRSRDAKRRSKKRKKDNVEVEAPSASAATEQACSSDASSADSSPVRRPSIQGRGIKMWETLDSATRDVYEKLDTKYHEKIDRHSKLVTLDRQLPRSCLVNQNLLPVRDSATKMIFQAAKAVLGVSSYVDGKLLNRSSGFLIEWGEASTILTSALLIRSKSPSIDEWLGKDEYVPNAKVFVHLLDKEETTLVAHLLYYDKHYNVALFRVDMNLGAQNLCFGSEAMCGQEIFVLGRDAGLNLKIDHGSVQYKGPSIYNRHHYMFFSCVIAQCGVGGPVIDFDGAVVGMANVQGNRFIPSCIILKCLDMWKKFQCIPRLHMGMKFSAIKFLDPAHVEKISRKCNVNAGLIVEEVCGGSVAEEVGVRTGDIIECLNGECIATTIELENMLMSICENYLDRREGIGCTVDVTAIIVCLQEIVPKVFDDDVGPDTG